MGLPLHMNDCCSVKRVLFIDDANDIKVNQLIKNAGVLKRDINIKNLTTIPQFHDMHAFPKFDVAFRLFYLGNHRDTIA